jgi:hypothetical protein
LAIAAFRHCRHDGNRPINPIGMSLGHQHDSR